MTERRSSAWWMEAESVVEVALRGPPAKCNEHDENMPTSLWACAKAAVLLKKQLVDITGLEGDLGRTGPLCGYDATADEIAWNGDGIIQSSWGLGNIGQGWKAACIKVGPKPHGTLLIVGVVGAVLVGCCALAWSTSTLLKNARYTVEEIPAEDWNRCASEEKRSKKSIAKPVPFTPTVISRSACSDEPSMWTQATQIGASAPGNARKSSVAASENSKDGEPAHGTTVKRTTRPAQTAPEPETPAQGKAAGDPSEAAKSPKAAAKIPPADADACAEAKAVEKKLRSLKDRSLPERKRIVKDLLLEYHPDKNGDAHAKEVFQFINNARAWFLHDG